jgi:hypothetical protein
MARFRSHGWKPEELKIYWNAKQLENLSPKHETNDKQIEEKEKTKLEADHDSKDEAKNNQIKEESETKVEESDEVKNKELAAPVETNDNQIQKEEKTELKADDDSKDEESDEVKNKHLVAEDGNLPPHDPSDVDVILSLRRYPVSKRNHAGKITYVNKGIERAVFDAPEDAQLIVLNFAVSHSLDIFLDYISIF